MSLFQRAVVNELSSHAGIVFSTLLIVWVSVLLVRLLGDAAVGSIGADVVLGLAAFSTVTALPTVIAVSVFIAVLTTVSRSYRESEMVVWFSSGLSLAGWLRPVLRFTLPAVVLVLILTLIVAPWAYRQIGEYRVRFEQRSDISRVVVGQFAETEGGQRVFVAEAPTTPDAELGAVFLREQRPGRDVIDVVVSSGAHIETLPNGDRFLVLTEGQRYELAPGEQALDFVSFERYGARLEQRGEGEAGDGTDGILKARATSRLLEDDDARNQGELLWRLSLPWVVLNLALLAIPLGVVNPRLGRSGDLLMAGLIALLYLNLVGLMRSWVGAGDLPLLVGLLPIHLLVGAGAMLLLRHRLRVRMPRAPATPPPAAS